LNVSPVFSFVNSLAVIEASSMDYQA